jgi:hypothetical protein
MSTVRGEPFVTATASGISPRRRDNIIGALRRGTVPAEGLDQLAVGIDHFTSALGEELDQVSGGGAVVKAVRGKYGSGKTFFTRHLAERALQRGFATAEVQISETETPLYRLETIYRRITESLRTASVAPSAFRSVLDTWLYTIEEDAIAADPTTEQSEKRLADATGDLLDTRLAEVSSSTPAFALALRAYHRMSDADPATADGLAAWLAGQPHVAASAKRAAGIKGDLDHFGAMSFLQGLLTVLRDAGHPGLLLVLDEFETLQRMRSDVRDKALNALRQLMDEIDAGRYPGFYLVLTGTPAFYDGPNGVHRLPPLAQRLDTPFMRNPRFDNPRAVQIRLLGFTQDSLAEVGMRVRDLYVNGREDAARLQAQVDDAYVADFARAVAGELGAKVGLAPRIFLRKLVDVLDRVDQFKDFDPRSDYSVSVSAADLAVAGPRVDPDDVDLDLGDD